MHPVEIPHPPIPPTGWIPGVGYFDILRTKPEELKAWHEACREWKIKYDGWH